MAILKRAVFPRVLTAAERRRLGDPPDLLALTVRWVIAAARRLGRRRDLGVAFLEEADQIIDGYSEIPRLIRAFAARGIRTAHGRPEELRAVGGRVRLRGVQVDLAYRDLAYEDLDGSGGRLGGFRALHAGGAVVPDPAGEFGHKGLLECLTGPAYAALFSSAERRLLRRCVPWTRVLGGRRVEGPQGRSVDLPEYARRHASRLVIKPNVGLERGGGPPRRRGLDPRLGGAHHAGAPGARGLGGPGAPAGHPASHALSPQRAGLCRALSLLARPLLCPRRPRAPLPGEPAADRQRGERRGPGLCLCRDWGEGG